jgi:hypothetical protein
MLGGKSERVPFDGFEEGLKLVSNGLIVGIEEAVGDGVESEVYL